MSTKWRITELQKAVEIALAESEYNGQASARVQTIPDTRAIRYYTTLGILDRASEMRGRTAFYDRRHLLQLVAIKRLQSDGKSLGDIQLELTGATNQKLRGLAKLNRGFWELLEQKLAARNLKDSTEKISKNSKRPRNQAALTRTLSLDSPTEIANTDQDLMAPRSTVESDVSFWAAPVEEATIDALPTEVRVHHETRLEFPGGITISIPVHPDKLSSQEIEQLLPAAEQLFLQVEALGLGKTSETNLKDNSAEGDEDD